MKLKILLKALSILAVLLLAACRSNTLERPDAVNLNQQLETLGVLPYLSPTPSRPVLAQGTATEPASPEGCPEVYNPAYADRTGYELFLYLGVEEHAGYVEERIVYPNLSGETLEELLLVVDPNWIPGAFTLSRLKLAGLETAGYQIQGGYLRIPLEVPLPPGCSLELGLDYHLEIPERAGIFGYTEDQLVLTNWYPFIPPYHPGQGWVIHDPGIYGEHLVYTAADFSVTLELAESLENVLVAAPALADQDGNSYRYSLKGARTFSLVLFNGYTVKQQDLNGIKVSVFSKRATIREVEAALSTAITAIEVFERLFGPYPFQNLAIVQLEMYDGMEYDGMFFLSEEVFGTYNWGPRNMLVYLTAHETCHNWWFSQTANDQALEPWLDEALATYSELLFYEVVYPEEVDWWWDYRVEQYEPVGDVDATIYTYGNYEAYRQAVYLRGVEFLQALRKDMGDDAFFAFLRTFLERGRYQLVTTEDFFTLLEEEFAVDTADLRQQYFGGR